MDKTNIRDNSIRSREASNIHQEPQQQQQDLTTRKLATAAGLAPVEIPTTILPSAGTPTATEVQKTVWTPTTHDFFEKFAEKLFRMAKNLRKKRQSKNCLLFV
jgi:hypothetical protein